MGFSSYSSKLYVVLKNIYAFTCIHMERHSRIWTAANNGNTEIVHMLIEDGADVNERDDSTLPFPLWAAFAHSLKNGSSLALAQVLIDAGADIESINSKNMTPLLYFNRTPEILRLLLNAGANIHAVDDQNASILSYLGRSNNQELVIELYHRGVNLSRRNNLGCTCLHFAASYNQPDMILTLLDLDVDVDIATNSGQTALHMASSSGNKRVVEILLTRNADIGALVNGMTAMQIAVLQGHHEVAAIIEREEQRRNRIQQPLILAFAMGMHPRVGQGSLVGLLSPDLARIIAGTTRL